MDRQYESELPRELVIQIVMGSKFYSLGLPAQCNRREPAVACADTMHVLLRFGVCFGERVSMIAIEPGMRNPC